MLDTLKSLMRESLPHGVVGMNFRNRHLVARLNPRSEIAVARDKVATKERLAPAGVRVAPTLGVINKPAEVDAVYRQLCESGLPFVIKPARSAQGRGILLCRKATPDGVQKLSGAWIPPDELRFHLHQILHGEFSFGRPHDAILVEGLLETDSDWIMPGLPGAPDLRIIICEGELLLAMARLPTSISDGRANLHCGAVGIGIDLLTGRTHGGVQLDKPVAEHPDTRLALEGCHVQDFDRCLELAHRCFSVFKLGYMGIDLMRDRQLGPVVLEVNSRPGLGLQIANRRGLFHALRETA